MTAQENQRMTSNTSGEDQPLSLLSADVSVSSAERAGASELAGNGRDLSNSPVALPLAPTTSTVQHDDTFTPAGTNPDPATPEQSVTEGHR